jgi:hypothetical protein
VTGLTKLVAQHPELLQKKNPMMGKNNLKFERDNPEMEIGICEIYKQIDSG